MANQDLYQVLGVTSSAVEKDIRQAYRKLARKFHPDLNPNDKSAEKRFKEIQHAYDVLNDKEKRAKYDRFGPDFERIEAGAASAPGGGAGRQSYTWQSGQPGQADFDVGEMFGGNLFGTFFEEGRGSSRRANFRNRMANARGEDVEYPVEVTLEEAHQGATRMVQQQSEDGALRTLEVKIPAGVADGSRVRMAGQGGFGRGTGARGDLFLVVSMRPHPLFERKGDDLHVNVPASLTTAVLGGEVQVPTPKGTRLALKVPAESQNGQRFRLSGQGMPRLGGDGRGDLYAELKVQLPRDLTDRERQLFRELAELRKEAAVNE